ncbi:plasmalemma vesicle-associated protein isoform X2 [Talpa occidentalis]|uniref:plasmalemma vesicle-associated protein isoform X2 n=1 Tax=Talpa occidentalis TaxID=50954 RepID=UPI00188E8951|nr:plasmalemma vesicle-associated protein isoform X2 [Talpa occidentalis]
MGLAVEHGGPYTRAGSSSRGCWYYLRYFFLFVSLIQFLIIVGLVLFMVYGNPHENTESNLQATEQRAQTLYTQVVGLTATRANLSKVLNLTAKSKESIQQQLLSTRRDLDAINASFRQCNNERMIHNSKLPFIAAIISSEEQCLKQCKENNKTHVAVVLSLNQKIKDVEVDMAKEKVTCAKDKETLALGKRLAEEQTTQCAKNREQVQQELRLAEGERQKVFSLCLRFDKGKFEEALLKVWQDSIISRNLDAMSYSLYSSELSSTRRICELLPTLMSAKVEELARSLRADIEHVTRENSDLQRQKLETEQRLQASEEAKQKMEKEAQARETKLHAECARQTQLALEEKATLRKERDNLAKELEEKKKEAEQLKTQLASKDLALDTCLRAKSQLISLPRPVVPAPNPPPIDRAELEEFKKMILESQRLPAGNAISPPSG